MAQLNGMVAIITGSSSGIGRAAAVKLSKEGCSVCLAGRDILQLEITKKECIEQGLPDDKILQVVVDLLEDNACKSLVDQTITKFGQLNILVNNAGIVLTGRVEDAPISDYDRVMNINVRSIIQLTQHAIPHLKKTKGTIVNVSSINGPCSFPGVTFYCMSKSALDQFTKCLSLELAPDGVRVNSVNPGVVVTNVHKRAGMSDEQYAKFLDHSKSTHALGRVGEAKEVAEAIFFLASSLSSFTTGTLLRVDGGRGVMTPR